MYEVTIHGDGTCQIGVSETPRLRGPSEWTEPRVITADRLAKSLIERPEVRVNGEVRVYRQTLAPGPWKPV